MDFAEEAFLLQKSGKLEEAQSYYQKAFSLEKEAAMLMTEDYSIEPSRSNFV